MLFCTLYPQGERGDLFRDPGQIPYNLAVSFDDVSSELVTCGIDENIPFFDNKRYKVIKIDKLFNSYLLAGMAYLLLHARDIDWLNLYHCRRQTLILAKFYKLLNRRGKVYVKLDAGFQTIELLRKKEGYLKTFRRLNLIADLMSVESKTMVESLNELSCRKLIQVPNGTYLQDVKETIEKKNVFLTVARIGSPEKNNDLLMEAFAKIADRCNWNLMMVGNINADFKPYIKSFFDKYPYLKERVEFVGNIDSRKELTKIYKNAKVFVLPSLYENFSLACVEALQNGCYTILSDQVTPYMELTNSFQYGIITRVNDVDDLANKMLEATRLELNDSFINDISEYARINFSWSSICSKLYKMLDDNVSA